MFIRRPVCVRHVRINFIEYKTVSFFKVNPWRRVCVKPEKRTHTKVYYHSKSQILIDLITRTKCTGSIVSFSSSPSMVTPSSHSSTTFSHAVNGKTKGSNYYRKGLRATLWIYAPACVCFHIYMGCRCGAVGSRRGYHKGT